MNVKDRRIHLFLQIFFLLVGLYQLIRLITAFQSGQLSGDLFEFNFNELPVLVLAGGVIAGITSLISSMALWTRASWACGFTLFTAGILFSFHLTMLGPAIYHNSYQIIPFIIILIVILQSFPFLLRRSYRSA